MHRPRSQTCRTRPFRKPREIHPGLHGLPGILTLGHPDGLRELPPDTMGISSPEGPPQRVRDAEADQGGLRQFV